MQRTKKDVVVLALADLGGATAPVDTEDVAIAAHRRAQVAFGWRKHPEHIDLDVVRTSLRHEKESTEPRLDGSIRTGWHLTAAGQRWVRDQGGGPVLVAETPARTAARRAETREEASTVDRLRSSSAFRAWADGRPFTARDAAAAFRIDRYTPQRDRLLRTARFRELVAAHADLIVFLDAAVPVVLDFGTTEGTP